MDRLRLGTRGSALALWQTRHFAGALRRRYPELALEECVVASDGDLDAETPVAKLEPGVFVRRLERALVACDVDLVVHSLKDLPTAQPEGLCIATVLERHDPRDTLLSVDGHTLWNLPRGARVGTGSFRRRSQLLHLRPDLEVVPLRGNVDTRVAKVRGGEFTAVVLAAAGIERLELDSVPAVPISVSDSVPAVGQGAIAVEIRSDDAETRGLVEPLTHARSWVEVSAERVFLHRLGGGCLAPASAHARTVEGQLQVEGFVGDPDGRSVLLEREAGSPADAETIGARLAERLLVAGAERILADARRMADPDATDG